MEEDLKIRLNDNFGAIGQKRADLDITIDVIRGTALVLEVEVQVSLSILIQLDSALEILFNYATQEM